MRAIALSPGPRSRGLDLQPEKMRLVAAHFVEAIKPVEAVVLREFPERRPIFFFDSSLIDDFDRTERAEIC